MGGGGGGAKEIGKVVCTWCSLSKFHRLIRRSSADMKVSPSTLTESELMW